MLPAIALVASGLQAVGLQQGHRHTHVGGEIIALEEIRLGDDRPHLAALKSSVLVHAQYLPQHVR